MQIGILSKLIGGLFLLAMAAAIAGNGLLLSIVGAADYLEAVLTNRTAVRVAGVLLLANSIAVVGIGVFVYQLLAQQSALTGRGYLAARIVEAIVLLYGVLSLMSLIPLAEEYATAPTADKTLFLALGKSAINGNWNAYNMAMIVLGLGSLPFCRVLFSLQAVPRALSALGFAGYSILAVTSLLALLGFDVGLLVTLPVFLFEVVLGGWLLIRGFSWPPEAPFPDR